MTDNVEWYGDEKTIQWRLLICQARNPEGKTQGWGLMASWPTCDSSNDRKRKEKVEKENVLWKRRLTKTEGTGN